jgi:hypothetical protein
MRSFAKSTSFENLAKVMNVPGVGRFLYPRFGLSEKILVKSATWMSWKVPPGNLAMLNESFRHRSGLVRFWVPSETSREGCAWSAYRVPSCTPSYSIFHRRFG